MKERYKVLAAILALGEFTVEEIATKTGVKPNTVSTILARERGSLEKIADEKTGRRGGPRKRYRIKPGSADDLHSELRELNALATLRPLQTEPKPRSIPLGLLAAEDTLLVRYANAEDPEEKQRLLRLAKLDYKKGLSESRRLLAANPGEETRNAIEGSLRRGTALQKFFELDLLAHSSLADSQREVNLETLRNRVLELSSRVSEAINGLNPVLASVRQLPTSKLRQAESSLSPQHVSYTTAKSLLDLASLAADAKEKSALLDQASNALDVVWQDYEGRDTPLITLGFIRYEQGRLQFLLQGYKNARMFFNSAREIFATSDKHFDEVIKVDQHLAVLSVREFRLDQPDAPAQMEIETTFSALEGIDSKSQANYPLIRFLKNLLTKTISRFSVIERLLKQEVSLRKKEIESLRQQIEVLKQKLQETIVPQEPSWPRSPSLQSRFGKVEYVPVVQSRPMAAAAAAAAHAGVEISHEQRVFAREVVELRHSVPLSGQDSLSCSRFDEIRPSRNTFELSDI